LGIVHQKGEETVLIFNMNDTEVRIPVLDSDMPLLHDSSITPDSRSVLAYPAEWTNNFGNNYYIQTQSPELAEFTTDKDWRTFSEGQPFKEPDLQITSKDTIQQNIAKIIREIKEEHND
jgi:hypothetical protein